MTPACPPPKRALEPDGWNAPGTEANRIGRSSKGVRLWRQGPQSGCTRPAGFPVPAAYAMPGWVGDSFFSSVLEIEDRPRALLRTPHVSDARLEGSQSASAKRPFRRTSFAA